MQIHVTTDNHITTNEDFNGEVAATVEAAFERFKEHLTRVEVHLTDENSHKGGSNDKRCVIEAKPRGHQNLAVTHHAATLDEAVDGATERMEHLMDHTFGRLGHQNHKGQTSMGGDQRI